MPLIDRNIHNHAVFCFLANSSNEGDESRDLSRYNYKYPNSILVGIMDRFDSNAGFLLHIGPDSNCEFFQVISVPGFVADENATRVVLQYQWFNRNPSIVTGLKESIVSFLDNASKSDIYITASFASIMGFFGDILGKLFGVDSDDTESFKKAIAFIAYVFQQGKAIIQEKDILGFAGMDIPSNTFTFRKTYITLAYSPDLTSIDMAISDAMTLKLFPSIMGLVPETDETNGDENSDIVKLVASIIASVFLKLLSSISNNYIYRRKYKNTVVKIGTPEKNKELQEKLALPEGQGNYYYQIEFSVPVKKGQEEERLFDSSIDISFKYLYNLAKKYNDSKYKEHDEPAIISYLLGKTVNDLSTNIYNDVLKLFGKYAYPKIRENCSIITRPFCKSRDIKMKEYIKYMYISALLAPFFLLTDLNMFTLQEMHKDDKTKPEPQTNVDNIYDSYLLYRDDLMDFLRNLNVGVVDILIGISRDIKSFELYKLQESLSEFRSIVQQALQYINEKMLVNGKTYIIEEEVLEGEVLQAVIVTNPGRFMKEENSPYDFTNPAKVIRSIQQKADSIKFSKVQHNVVHFLYKFGIMLVKPPGGYHFIPDYRAILGAIIHGRPCMQMDTGFEELQSITYKLAYYGFTYRNIYRNILGVVDGDTALNSAHISYMLPSQLVLSSSETFTYAPLPTQYAEPAVPTWTKMEVSFTPMNNFIFFFGNYANLYDLYDGLGLDTFFANKS